MGDFTTLSIDLGSTLGYCIGKNGVIIESGEVTLSVKEAGIAHPGHRYMKFQQWLQRFVDSNGNPLVNEILFEDVMMFKSVAASNVYGGMRAFLLVFALAYKIRMLSLKPTQIKKDFTGYGNSKKDVVCDVAMKLGWKNGIPGTMNNNNESDAIALYWVVCTRRNIEPSFLKT